MTCQFHHHLWNDFLDFSFKSFQHGLLPPILVHVMMEDIVRV
jgi:hypothetical protein